GADAALERKAADPVERLLAERRNQPRDPLADAEEERLQQLPEVQEYVRQMGERHWEAWLDTRLPALGNRTPRRCENTGWSRAARGVARRDHMGRPAHT